MRSEAQITLSALRWTRRQILRHGGDTTPPGPAMPRCVLGRLVVRTDSRTIVDIVRDMDNVDERYANQEADAIRQREIDDWRPRSRAKHDDLVLAERLSLEVRRTFDDRDLEMIDRAVTCRSWREMERVYPGRVWWSIRDDVEKMLVRLWSRCQREIEEVSER